jgi:hypothetical protein
MKNKPNIILPIPLNGLTDAFELLEGRPDVCRFKTMWRMETLTQIANEAMAQGVTRLHTRTRVANSYNKGYHPGYAAEVKMEFVKGVWWITEISREERLRCSNAKGRNWKSLPAIDPLVPATADTKLGPSAGGAS